MQPKLAILAASALVGTALAADCASSPSNWYYDGAYQDAWDVRGAVCGSGVWNDKWSGHAHGVGPGNAANCWDAFENIINQCIYAENKPGGTYSGGFSVSFTSA